MRDPIACYDKYLFMDNLVSEARDYEREGCCCPPPPLLLLRSVLLLHHCTRPKKKAKQLSFYLTPTFLGFQ
jgi:hypothetical protein